MPGLTPDQILTGAKGYARNIPAPDPEPARPGRWRCLLCPWPAWTHGTYDDWIDHYRTRHGKDS